jgi:TolB-like protein
MARSSGCAANRGSPGRCLKTGWRFQGETPISAAGSSLTYKFDRFELDTGAFELRADGAAVHVEPQVLSLLILLAGNPDRLVGKDEIVEKVWGGRIVSEAAVAARIKSARKALGDDGKRQRFIRTVHGKGLRFVAPVSFVRPAEAMPAPENPDRPAPAGDDRPSIAVLPFAHLGGPGPLAFLAEALADELIGDLARLRWLLVIARASSFRFRNREIDCAEVGAALRVKYCLTGTLEEAGRTVTLSVQLARTSDNALVWAERFSAPRAELDRLRQEVLAAVIANLEVRIPQSEAQLARRSPLAALDAWSLYHLGLDHMFRFNKADNASAAALFERALAIDNDFSRALSGLSFTSFQDAFLQYSPDVPAKAERARVLAEQALLSDPLDPFAHLNLGRALWLHDGIPQSVDRLSECIALSPNYAQAIYSKAWAEMTQCDSDKSAENAALALRLSPLDPLRYAFLAVRSMSALLAGDYAAAADWGDKAAHTPGAHKLVALIAAMGNNAAGKRERAAQWVGRARQLDPHVSQGDFLSSFPFAPSQGRELVERQLRDLGV